MCLEILREWYNEFYIALEIFCSELYNSINIKKFVEENFFTQFSLYKYSLAL